MEGVQCLTSSGALFLRSWKSQFTEIRRARWATRSGEVSLRRWAGPAFQGKENLRKEFKRLWLGVC